MENNKNIASPLLRIIATLIDKAIFILPILLFTNSVSNSNDLFVFLNKITLILCFVYYPVILALVNTFIISYFGGTIGKILTGTRIVDSTGNNLTFWKAFLRNHVGYMISGLLFWIGFIWIFVDKERRSWHDMIAGSYVVLKNSWMFVFGLVFLVVLVLSEFRLINNTILNYKSNPQVYADLIDTLKTNFGNLDTVKTSNWQTFDSAYGYTIKYPESWTANAPGWADPTLFNNPVFNSPCNYNEGDRCMQVFVSSVPYGPDTDPNMGYEMIDETNKFMPNFIINTSDKTDNVEALKVDGVEARGFEYFQSQYFGTRWLYVVVFDRNNVRYTITYEEQQKDKGVITPNDWENKKVFDTMISTFKFTK